MYSCRFSRKRTKICPRNGNDKIGAGGKFDKDSYKVSGGLHGVGVSCVNAFLTDDDTTVYRDGNVYQQVYARGKAQTGVEEIGHSEHRGTKQFFQPDDTILQGSL